MQITSGNNITERRITNSGKKMYEAIISDDIATRQELLMDAVENVIFGKIMVAVLVVSLILMPQI